MSDKMACGIYGVLSLLNFGLFLVWPDTAMAPVSLLTTFVMLMLAFRHMARM